MPPTANTWRIAAITSLAVVAGGVTWVTLDPNNNRTDGPLAVASTPQANTTTEPASSTAPTTTEPGSPTSAAATPAESPASPPADRQVAPTNPAAGQSNNPVVRTPNLPPPERTATSPTPRTPTLPAVTPKPAAPKQTSGSLKISGINVSMPVIPVGVDADTGMTVPEKPEIAGWYKFGPAPGDTEGSAVITAHVDSRKYGPGPLAALRRTKPGATITVTHGGRQHQYRVVRTDQYKKTALDTAKLFDRSGSHRLHVVTCGGKFNRKTGHYDDNVVVLAEPIR